MLTAIEPATDQSVAADEASPWHSYRCPRCNAPVVLRAGSIRTRHFAHASGLADPDCEEYFGGPSVSTGRYYRTPVVTDSAGNGVETAALCFECESNGPTIGLWLPPAGGLPNWGGYVEVLATNTNRRLSRQLLDRGEMVQFPLVDGQWLVRIDGEVSLAYVSRLVCGPASLDADINVFDAERVPGQVVGPASPVRLGSSVWIVTRDPTLVGRRPKCLPSEEHGTYGGWIVLRTQLPTTASVIELREMQQWLHRRIRPALAKVWIETPDPVSVTPWGAQVFALSDGPMTIRADQCVDICIQSYIDGSMVSLGIGIREAVWNPTEPGTYRIRVNNLAYLTVVVQPTAPTLPSAIEVKIGTMSFSGLYEAQKYLECLDTGQLQRTELNVRWSSNRIAEVVHSQRGSLEVSAAGIHFQLAPGALLSMGELGSLALPLNPAPSAAQGTPSSVLSIAVWLLGVSRADRKGPVSLRNLPNKFANNPMLRELRERSWSTKYAAHVASLVRQIKGLS